MLDKNIYTQTREGKKNIISRKEEDEKDNHVKEFASNPASINPTAILRVDRWPAPIAMQSTQSY